MNERLTDLNNLMDEFINVHTNTDDKSIRDFIEICIQDLKNKIHNESCRYVDGR